MYGKKSFFVTVDFGVFEFPLYIFGSLNLKSSFQNIILKTAFYSIYNIFLMLFA